MRFLLSKPLQPEDEKRRLEEFFEATKAGPEKTLITQSKHRKADMLYDPEVLIQAIKNISDQLEIDMFVDDILSYGVTLALYACQKPFITFCPPHPHTIPDPNGIFGVPKAWPSPIKVSPQQISNIVETLAETQKLFTEEFNQVIKKHRKTNEEIDNAFRLISETAVVYNYLDFDKKLQVNAKRPKHLFIGHSFQANKLSKDWLETMNQSKKKILISLGTFLSVREDVLKKLIVACKKAYPEAILYVAGGKHSYKLRQYLSKEDVIEEFIPQIELLPYMDLVIHHGGNNTFTEALYYELPMIILPFSSDQFNIAYDAQQHGIAEVVDPNAFESVDVIKALIKLEENSKEQLMKWSHLSRERGVDYAVRQILEIE